MVNLWHCIDQWRKYLTPSLLLSSHEGYMWSAVRPSCSWWGFNYLLRTPHSGEFSAVIRLNLRVTVLRCYFLICLIQQATISDFFDVQYISVSLQGYVIFVHTTSAQTFCLCVFALEDIYFVRFGLGVGLLISAIFNGWGGTGWVRVSFSVCRGWPLVVKI